MKIGIYAPYLEVFGGGEKYICKIAEVLSAENDVEFIVNIEPNIKELQNRLNVNFNDIHINVLNKFGVFHRIPYFRNYAKDFCLRGATKKNDIFINQEHRLSISSQAKKSFLICEVPPIKQKNSSQYAHSVKFSDSKIGTYHEIVANSNYTKKWAELQYGKYTEVLYPPIDIEHFLPHRKKNILLNVGRFFVDGHCKKQYELVKIFKNMYEENSVMQDWEFDLAGGVKSSTLDQNYLIKCKKEAQGYPINFYTNINFAQLKELYGQSKIFWFATGLDENENEHPDRMEHFGIATIEAMSSGCVPIVINKGGQPEIVRHGLDGFCWNNKKELETLTLALIRNEDLLEKMSKKSIKRSKDFDTKKFAEKVVNIFT